MAASDTLPSDALPSDALPGFDLFMTTVPSLGEPDILVPDEAGLPIRLRYAHFSTMPKMGPLPKPFLTLLLYDAAIWAALLAVIGITIGGDPAWLAAIGIGGVGLTSWAACFVNRSTSAGKS